MKIRCIGRFCPVQAVVNPGVASGGNTTASGTTADNVNGRNKNNRPRLSNTGMASAHSLFPSDSKRCGESSRRLSLNTREIRFARFPLLSYDREISEKRFRLAQEG